MSYVIERNIALFDKSCDLSANLKVILEHLSFCLAVVFKIYLKINLMSMPVNRIITFEEWRHLPDGDGTKAGELSVAEFQHNQRHAHHEQIDKVRDEKCS